LHFASPFCPARLPARGLPERERGTDIFFLGTGVALVIATGAFMRRDVPPARGDGPRST
jgi:hypothetical protein